MSKTLGYLKRFLVASAAIGLLACGGAEGGGQDDAGLSLNVSISVNEREQHAGVEVSAEARQALEVIADTRGHMSVEAFVQQRLQEMANEGTIPFEEGTQPQVLVEGEQEEAAPGLSLMFQEEGYVDPPTEPCVVSGTYTLGYHVYVSGPTCTYYYVYDVYSGLYNTCNNSWMVLNYWYSGYLGPYAC